MAGSDSNPKLPNRQGAKNAMVKMAYCEGTNNSLEVPITAFSGSSLQSPEDRVLGDLGLPVRGTQTGVMAVQVFFGLGLTLSWYHVR